MLRGHVNEMLRSMVLANLEPQPMRSIFMQHLHLTVRSLDPCLVIGPVGKPNDPDGEITAIRGRHEASHTVRGVPRRRHGKATSVHKQYLPPSLQLDPKTWYFDFLLTARTLRDSRI